MLDRRVVESLEAQGDPSTQARRVDHGAYFAKSGSRDGFADAVARLGFFIAGRRGDAEGPRPDSVRVHRVEHLTLEEIHSTVMELRRLAEAHDGEYDGWEASVEKVPGD